MILKFKTVLQLR